MIDLYLKALHVIAVISWMAGLLYLPRLFVYHAVEPVGSEPSERFKVMERRLFRFIMRPAMIVSWVAGLWLAWSSFGFKGGWLHAKLLLVVLMTVHHELQGRWLREFADDKRVHAQKFFRIQNEIPTLLMIAIVIFVIVKPF
ncbi:MAG: protoporphyrinogen oxidase HemJ [Proteobacteria bacterium]|nr:protoporphyrinogen oxidase HemJ [Pseudomonadota bacterium]